MTTLVAGNVGVDMSTWAFTPGWKGQSHTDTQFVIALKGTTKVDTFTGHDFGGYDGNGFPTLGTITGLQFAENSQTVVTMSDFSITVADERAFANAQNMSGFLNQVFAGDDSLTDGTGNDHLQGFGGNDTFDMTNGGTDTADGGFGNDEFDFGDKFGAADSVNGDSGFDSLFLNGDYSGGVVFNATTMTGIEQIGLGDGHSYDLTVNDGNLSFSNLTVDGSALEGLDDNDEDATLTFDGSAENDSSFHLIGGDNGDSLTGGASNDLFDGGEGADTMNGNDGSDTVDFGRAFNGVYVDLQNGFAQGQGNDTLSSIENVWGSFYDDTIYGSDTGNLLIGNDGSDYIYGGGGPSPAPIAGATGVAALSFDSDFIDGGEGFDHLFGGDGNDLIYGGIDDDEVDGGNDDDNLFGDDGNDTIYGGQGNDTGDGGRGSDSMYGGDGADVMRGFGGRDHLYGGDGDDRLVGGGQHDVLDGGEGADTFHFDITNRALGQPDTIVGFDASEDKIDIAQKVHALDPTAEGSGSVESLASDLGNHHAQLVIQDRGEIDADHHARGGVKYFIVVDVNGTTGYQAGEDLLIRLQNPVDVQSLDVHDFI